MTISTMNAKSDTNGILPHRTKRGITLDLKKANYYDLKRNGKSSYPAFLYTDYSNLVQMSSNLRTVFSVHRKETKCNIYTAVQYVKCQ